MSRPALALDRLLSPRSIAVIGASPDPNSVSGRVRRNLKAFGYAGVVHLVSRTRDEVDGERCLRRVEDLPHGVDTAVVMTPQEAVVPTLEACGRMGVGAAVVFASGFAEAGEAGLALQARIAQVSRAYGIAVLGPNCMGLINFGAASPLTFEDVPATMPEDGPQVCIIGQSGAMTANTRLALIARGLRVSHSISTGNEAAVGLEQLMAHLVDAPQVQVFTLFAESLRDPALFLQTCSRARAAGKPVVLLHPGRSQGARDAARSHTGALAGDHDVMRALVTREGVALVDTLDELFDTTALLARYPQPVAGQGVAVVSNSGALRGIAIDTCADLGMALAKLGDQTLAGLREVLPDYVTPDNPLDVSTAGMQRPALFGESARTVLQDPQVGSLLMALMGGGDAAQVLKAQVLLPVFAGISKPAAFVIMGDEDPLATEFTARVKASHIPFFRSPDRALRALAHVHRRSAAMAELAERVPPPLRPAAPRVSPGPLAEYKGKELLREIGIAVPAGELARTPDQAATIAARIGYPVVLKAQADTLTHKSDVGGVAIGIADEASLRRAWTTMVAAVDRHAGATLLDGILVEAMAPPGVEFVLGARRDPAWGLVMLVGLGGTWIEVMKDVLLLPPDLSEAQILHRVRSLRGAAMLEGLRGQPRSDAPALARALRSLADYLRAHPEIAEVDINPFVVLPQGRGGLALDAVFIGADTHPKGTT